MQTKEEIAHSVKEELTKSMTSFGFSIIQTLVTGAPRAYVKVECSCAAAVWRLVMRTCFSMFLANPKYKVL